MTHVVHQKHIKGKYIPISIIGEVCVTISNTKSIITPNYHQKHNLHSCVEGNWKQQAMVDN